MILAISNETANVTASGNVDAGSNLLDLIDFTFDTFIKSAGATNLNLDFTGSSLPTYLGVAGHNLGTIGATITVINNGATVISNYAPADDRPLMFPFAENGSGTVELIDVSICRKWQRNRGVKYKYRRKHSDYFSCWGRENYRLIIYNDTRTGDR